MKQFNFLSKLSEQVVTRLKPLFTHLSVSWCFVSVLCLLLTFGAGSAWGITVSDISTTAATSLTDGGQYVVATAYNGTYLTTSVSSGWGGLTTSAGSAAIFTAHGSASGFYLTCSAGTLAPATSKTFPAYTSGTSNNLSLSASGDIQNSSNTSWKLRLNGASGFRWYSTATGSAVYLFAVSTSSPTLTVSGNATSLAIGDAKINGSGVTNSTLTFSGANLTANATLSITGTNASMFSVEPTSVTPTSKTITDQTISVTYNPTSAGNHTATLTIASSGATSKTITLTGTGKYEVVWKCAGSADVTTLVASGQRPTFPSTPSSCDTGEGASTTFYGWATGTWSGKATNLEDSKLSGITIYTSAASMPTVSANGITYHAVFAKETSNYSNTTIKETFESQTASTTYNSTQTYGQSSSNAGIGWKMYYGTVSTTGALKGSKSAQMRWYKNSSSNYPYIQDTTQLLSLSKVKFKAKVGKTAVKMDVSYSTNKGVSWTKVGDAVTFANTDTITLSYDIPGADATKYLIKIGVSSSSTKPTTDYSSFQVDEVSFTYKTGSITYSNFMTTCCTALGSINGSVSWIKPDTAEITWDNVAHADSTWTLRYKTHAVSSWSNAWSAQVAGTSDKITIFSSGGTNNKLKARIGGLACNTDYDFRLVPKNVSGYCPDSLTMDNNGSGYNSGKWSITKGSETNGTFTIGASSSCSGSSISISASASTGYQFSSWTVAKAGGGNVDPAASSATTSFTMPSDNVTVTAAFSAINYTITYNLNGGTNPGGVPTGFTIESSDVTLPTPTRTGYTFAGWYENADLSTGGVKTTIVSGTHENKTYYAKWTVNWKFMYNGDSYAEHTFDNSKEWTQSLDGNTTYWFRISDGAATVYRLAGASTMTSASCTDWDFPKNAGTDCGIQTTAPGDYIFTLSDADPSTKVQISVTYPSSVTITLNLNGHGDDITWYAATGGTIPTPADPTASGFTFAGWYSDAGCNTPWNFSTTVNSATTLYAKWTQYYYYHEEWGDWAANQMTESADGNYWYWYTYKSGENRQFKIQQGGTWYGYTYNSPGFNCTDITNMNSSGNDWSVTDSRCAVNYNVNDRYYIIVYVPNTSINTTNNPIICASTSLPEASYDMSAGHKIYFDNSDRQWTNVYYRIGRACNNSVTQMTKVPGTQNLYQTTTAAYTNYIAFHIADNQATSGDNHSIYDVRPGSNNISNCINFQKETVSGDITLTPTTLNNTESSCSYYNVTETSGMKSHNASITAPTNGTITIGYSPADGSEATSFTSGNRDLAHTCILTISAEGATGYHLDVDGLTVNGDPFTSGTTHVLTADIVVAATFAANTNTAYTVKHYQQNIADDDYTEVIGDRQNLTGTTGASVTPAVNTYTGFMSPSTQTDVIAADGSLVISYYYTRNSYNLTWNLGGGTTTSAGTGIESGVSVNTTSSVKFGASITVPTVAKTGYNMTWSSTPAATMPAEATTYTANWSANNYIIALDNEGADSGKEGTESISVTYDAYTNLNGMPAITKPVKDGYLFGGYFVGDDGTGTQIIDADGNVIASVASYTSATKQWIYANNITLHAKWTKVHTVTWSVNDDTWSTGVVDGNTYVVNGQRVSALPTAPTKSDCDDSKVFVGWKALAIDGSSPSNPGGIFTTKEASPAITQDTTFYAVFADVSGGDAITLTFPDDNSENNKKSSYSNSWTATKGTNSWSIANFNNNSWNNSWTYIKCGHDGTAYVGTIATDAALSFVVDSVIINMTVSSTSNINSAKLYVSSNSDFSSSSEISIPVSGDDIGKIGISSSAKDKYYKIAFDCKAGTKGNVVVNSVVYKQNLDTANYVTSCSSCDADATFTNETPAVSEIGCTGATLTATGGLEKLGAEGCNVTDYGFVIGTTDDPAPAIGGSGVTKYQVGTTNPTTGADFSYDATGLTKGTHYYIRAYATNRHGTAYSSTQNFWTKDVSSIAITTAPTKTNYIVGETFDATGMVVTATMASGATEDVTSDVTYSSSALTAGTSQNFAINYTLCETEKSVNQVINVYTLTVTEGANPSYGTATNSSANIVSITGLGDHKTYTVTVTSDNADVVDNGDNTWSVINPTGNVSVRVDYDDAVQVKVYYKVDGVTVTGLTQDVYQSETTTLPTASELATAMAAQSMDIPDDDYPNFIGWSETEFAAQTAEPTLVTGTPTINAEKTYYAVYTNLSKKQILPSNFAGSYATNEGEKTIDGEKYQVHDICLQSSKIQFRNTPGYLYTKEALQYIKKIEITGLDLIVNACSDDEGTLDGDAITPTGSDTYVYTFPANKQYFKIKGKGGTDQVSLIEIFYASSTVYYMTEFCATKITLTQNSPEHGTIVFGKASVGTCGGDKDVTLTITPEAGYQLHSYEVATGSGKVTTKADPAISLDNNSNAAQNITLTFASGANGAYDVTASFTEMVASAWTWTKHVGGATITTEPVEVYVGQKVQVDVTYEPAGLLSSHTSNTSYDYSPSPWSNANLGSPAKAGDHLTVTGTNAGETSVVLNHTDGLTKTIYYTVLALEKVHFVDLVHGKAFADSEATLSGDKWTVSWDGNTPTSDDWTTPNANSCEEQHLHLVGWIREDWPALVAYLNGTGAAPTTVAITGAGNDGEGHAYYIAAGASINVQIFDGVTFYAVWAEVK